MSNSETRRRYVSRSRALAAEATRTRILETARALFSEFGVEKVTIARIATDADVAAPTIYALFGSKVGILRALMETVLFGARFQEARQRLDGVEDPVRLIALTADVMCAIYSGESTELGLLRGTSYLSPELRESEAEFEKIRLEMQRDRVERLFAAGLARPGLSLDEARRILWMYTSRDIYRMLVQEAGWDLDRFRGWLSETLVAALVDPAAAQTRRTSGASDS